MGGKGKETAQRLLAIIVIVAMLALMGIPPTVIIFFALVVFFVWRAVDRAEQNDTRRIFDFYIAANDILRDDERRWYGYEIAEVIGRGENILHAMNDAPPLLHFALGALYHRISDNRGAVDNLIFVLENEKGDERKRFAPSPELRRYVQILRRLEREPAEGPQSIAAVRSLERLERQRAAKMLEESREKLNASQQQPKSADKPRLATPYIFDSVTHDATSHAAANNASVSPTFNAPNESTNTMNGPDKPNITSVSPKPNKLSRPTSLAARTPPPSITEVLRDVYDEEKKTA